MPGRLFLTHSTDQLASQFAAQVDGDPDLQRLNIAPGQDIRVLTQDGRLTLMRWGIIPVGRVNARGRPVMETIVNARSETLFDKSAFDGVNRAVVPASGWYEWTGKARAKTAWRIRPKDGRALAFAAVTDSWAGPGGIVINQVATVTCEPNADVAPIHHRMGVLLAPGDVATWLTGTKEEAAALMRPYPDAMLMVEEATGVDWTGR